MKFLDLKGKEVENEPEVIKIGNRSSFSEGAGPAFDTLERNLSLGKPVTVKEGVCKPDKDEFDCEFAADFRINDMIENKEKDLVDAGISMENVNPIKIKSGGVRIEDDVLVVL